MEAQWRAGGGDLFPADPFFHFGGSLATPLPLAIARFLSITESRLKSSDFICTPLSESFPQGVKSASLTRHLTARTHTKLS